MKEMVVIIHIDRKGMINSKVEFARNILQLSCVDVTLLVGRSIWGLQCVILEFVRTNCR